MAVPGESPTSPLTVVGPVLVMALPANTANDDAVPRLTVAVAAIADWVPNAANVRNAIPVANKVPKESRRCRKTAGEEGCIEGPSEVDIIVLPKDRHASSLGVIKTDKPYRCYVNPAYGVRRVTRTNLSQQ